MKRFTIAAMVHVDVEANDEETAYENFCDALDKTDGIRDLSISHVEQVEVPFTWPAGAERWENCARAIRLGDEPGVNRIPVAGMYDGSWWWSNGHVLLRCEGAMPSDDKTWRLLKAEDVEKAVAPKKARRPTSWSEDVRSTASGFMHGRIATEDPNIGVQQRYHTLINDSLGEATWLIGGAHEPMHVTDREGRLMAVVMPMKTDLLVASLRTTHAIPKEK